MFNVIVQLTGYSAAKKATPQYTRSARLARYDKAFTAQFDPISLAK